ncbi:MAG: methionyl-tRNA synthetase [Flavobacteriales bacterium]|jgi:methionyl-tRNA synthetase|tara:strand:+ start:9048 stop:11090 length:2043 start_codon:yes stop_codon:yes gene_type:complete
MAKRFTVTTALPYANGPLHLGHVAGVYIPADIYVKYLKAKGEDVVFIGGTDEHGVPISIKAKNEGVTPKEVVNRYHNIIKQSLKGLGVSLDYFGQTSSKGHYETSSEWFTKLSDDGVFREEVSQQYYDEENNQFLADRYITGDCPECKKEGAYGDQCEKCGATLNATDLINPKSALSGNKPVLRDTKHWFLPLDKFEPWLKEWIEEMKPVLKANVYGQVKSWLDSGLHQRAITRDLDWGVPVPVKGGEGKVLYVWFDAPIGYVSFTKQLLEKDPNRNWEDYWKKDGDSQLVHFLGKDNIVFHSVIFPSMLKSMGDYILPQNVPANEFLNLEGEKFSTSKNWAVWLDDFLTDFPDKTDVLRYVLCSILPEQKDADFTWADFQAKNNNELVANLGNFVNRALVLTTKYWGGVVPGRNELTDLDKDVIVQLNAFPNKISASIEKHRYKEALSELMKLSALGNKYLAETEPWKLIKQDEERVKTIMNIALQITSSLAVLSVPFLPETANNLSEMINLEGLKWDALTEDNITEGHQINKPSLLFQRIDNEVVDEQRAKLSQAKDAAEAASKIVEPQKDTTSFDEFQKMDIRVGTIIEAEKIKKAKKLLKLKVDTGIDQRTVVSGIAQFFEPEKLIGQQVSILVNLSPRKMLGIESEGMILMAENNKGELQFVAPQGGSDNGGVIA